MPYDIVLLWLKKFVFANCKKRKDINEEFNNIMKHLIQMNKIKLIVLNVMIYYNDDLTDVNCVFFRIIFSFINRIILFDISEFHILFL